jgi:hypothetical protein
LQASGAAWSISAFDFAAGFLLNKSAEESDCERKIKTHPVACLDSPVDDKGKPCDEHAQRQCQRDDKAGTDESHNSRNKKPDTPGDLKIQHALACRIQARHFILFEEPDDQWSKNVAKAYDDKACEGAEMQDSDPLSRCGCIVIWRQWRRAWLLRVFHEKKLAANGPEIKRIPRCIILKIRWNRPPLSDMSMRS